MAERVGQGRHRQSRPQRICRMTCPDVHLAFLSYDYVLDVGQQDVLTSPVRDLPPRCVTVPQPTDNVFAIAPLESTYIGTSVSVIDTRGMPDLAVKCMRTTTAPRYSHLCPAAIDGREIVSAISASERGD